MQSGVEGVPGSQGGRLEGPRVKVKRSTRGLSGCLWGPKGPWPGDIQGVNEDVLGVLGNQGTGGGGQVS